MGRLVDLGQEIEDRGLARAVGADEARDLGAADGHVEVVHCLEAAEGNAQVDALEDRGLVGVALGDIAGARDGDEGISLELALKLGLRVPDVFGIQNSQAAGRHASFASFPFFLLSFSRSSSRQIFSVGLLVVSITTIRTIA